MFHLTTKFIVLVSMVHTNAARRSSIPSTNISGRSQVNRQMTPALTGREDGQLQSSVRAIVPVCGGDTWRESTFSVAEQTLGETLQGDK